MGDAIGQMLPSAIGIAISPVPIIAVVLMLVTRQAQTNGPAFVAGWWLGITVVGGIVLLVSSGTATSSAEPATWISLLKLVLGVALLLLAAKQWQQRPAPGAPIEVPGWMGALDQFTPIKAAGTAALLSGVNPKNLLLAVAGAAAIAQTGISGGEQAFALIVFVLIASIGVMAPVALYFLLGSRSRRVLDELKDWLGANNATIMFVLFLILGVKLVGEAIAGLS